jgi:hypothetical protein
MNKGAKFNVGVTSHLLVTTRGTSPTGYPTTSAPKGGGRRRRIRRIISYLQLISYRICGLTSTSDINFGCFFISMNVSSIKLMAIAVTCTNIPLDKPFGNS